MLVVLGFYVCINKPTSVGLNEQLTVYVMAYGSSTLINSKQVSATKQLIRRETGNTESRSKLLVAPRRNKTLLRRFTIRPKETETCLFAFGLLISERYGSVVLTLLPKSISLGL